MKTLLTDKELTRRLEHIPPYSSGIRILDKGERLSALNEIYGIYIPTFMACEIYTKLYLATLSAMEKKGGEMYVKQCNETYRKGKGIIGGADSLSITGASGIGKSSAVQAAMDIITEDTVQYDENDDGLWDFIPILQVQTPFDCSAKGLLIEVCRLVDEKLHTGYLKSATRTGTNTDTLIGLVSQVCLNHIGTLVIDEIQNVKGHKKGESLISLLTQLVNSSGISIVFVGTNDVIPFFEKKMQLARRSTGLHYKPLEYGTEFKRICEVLLSYIYTKDTEEITEEWIRWLFEHSGGVVAVVISLIHDAQEIAILSDDRFSMKSLNKVYKDRLYPMHKHIELNTDAPITEKKNSLNSSKESIDSFRKSPQNPKKTSARRTSTLQSLLERAKKEDLDMFTLLKANYTVEEIKL